MLRRALSAAPSPEFSVSPESARTARDRGGVPGAVVQRGLSLDDGVPERPQPIDSVDLPLGLRPPLPVQSAVATTEGSQPRAFSIKSVTGREHGAANPWSTSRS